mmetsp:Transcript_11868/g.29732  ORF Transcript_11868/g.29732 Transcript_11868/m.29732 type:complete len:296 (+) Transcript_11868:179-1066(+)
MVTHSHSLVLSNHNLALSRTQFSHDNPPIIHVAVWESCHCGEEDVITPLRRAVLVWPYSVERILGIPCASTRLVAALTTRGLERHPRISEAPIQKALVVVGRCLGACVEVSNNDAGVSLFMGLVRRFKRLLNLTLPYRIRPRVLWIDRAPCRCVQVDHAHYPRPLRRQLQVYHKLPLVCQQPLQRRSLPVCLKPDTRDRVLGQDHEAIVEPCGKQSSRASGGIPADTKVVSCHQSWHVSRRKARQRKGSCQDCVSDTRRLCWVGENMEGSTDWQGWMYLAACGSMSDRDSLIFSR